MSDGVHRGRWLLRRPDPDAAMRLFCFTYSGLGAPMYSRWPSSIGEVSVCAVQLPGRENRMREPHFGTYPELAELAAEGLLPYLDRPFGFFGHCGSALMAFATALRLVRAGRAPDWLFMSSELAPHDGPFGRFLQLTDEELVGELKALSLAMGGALDPDLLDLGLRVLRADLDANRCYRLAEPVVLPGQVHAISWQQDQEIRPEQMTEWREYADPGSYREVTLPGGHYAFLTAPDVLCDELEAAKSLPPSPPSSTVTAST